MKDDKTWVYNLAKTKISKVAQSKCEWLILERLGLSEMPASVFELEWLQELIFIDNLIETIPPQIGNLKNLKHLDVFYNKILTIPPEIGQLADLRHLNAGSNQLSTIPRELGQLSELTHLDLRDNQLHELPPELINLKNLAYLDLRGNPLPVDNEILDQVKRTRQNSSTTLSSTCGITGISRFFVNFNPSRVFSGDTQTKGVSCI